MTRLILPERCDRAAAEAMLPRLREAATKGDVAIDASQVGQIGQAMVQLLLSARKSAGARVVDPSAALRDTARLLGLADILFDGEAA